MAAPAGLQKAYLLNTDDNSQLACRFNPKEYTISKTSTWTRPQTPSAEQTPDPEYRNPDPRTLQMELFLDGWESTTGSVKDDIEKLFLMTTPTAASLQRHTPQPPIVAFMWGSNSGPLIQGFVKQVSARYTMFKSDGIPVRATVNLTIEETPENTPRQNPTSGGPGGRRTHTVVDGDSLQSIAYHEYGNASFWRAIANANGIDDPLRVPPGSNLLLPHAPEAAEWS